MKRNVISTTLAVLALSAAALFTGSAQADDTRIIVRFGDFSPPTWGAGYAGQRHGGTHHPVVWDGGRQRQDGFWPASVDQRQQRQHQRIVQGMRSGELTPVEVRQLRREQREIRHMERRYLADDRLSHEEWRRLDRELDEASRNIWRQKHDNQNRY